MRGQGAALKALGGKENLIIPVTTGDFSLREAVDLHPGDVGVAPLDQFPHPLDLIGHFPGHITDGQVFGPLCLLQGKRGAHDPDGDVKDPLRGNAKKGLAQGRNVRGDGDDELEAAPTNLRLGPIAKPVETVLVVQGEATSPLPADVQALPQNDLGENDHVVRVEVLAALFKGERGVGNRDAVKGVVIVTVGASKNFRSRSNQASTPRSERREAMSRICLLPPEGFIHVG